MFNLELIGKKIKEIRKRKKISQEALAEMVKMNARSILRLENAKTLPTLETLKRIATALSVDISDFFETNSFKCREDIIKDVNSCLISMSDDELKIFYKAVYNFIH